MSTTEVEVDTSRRHSLLAHRRDPDYSDIVKNTVIGLHYVAIVRLGKLQRDDPFRNQCLIWCEYFAENTLMMLSIAGSWNYNRAERIEEEAKLKESSRPTLVSGVLRRWVRKRISEVARWNEDNFPKVQTNHDPPPRLGKGTLFRATKVLAENMKNVDENSKIAAKNFRKLLEREIAPHGKTLPLQEQFEVYKTHLEAQARYCRTAVDYFYVKRLKAKDNISKRVLEYKRDSNEVVNFRPMAAELTNLANYISRFEAATKEFKVKNIKDQGYMYQVYEFMDSNSSREFDPKEKKLLRYDAAPPSWSLEYQFSGRD